ncbi:hypothetical protein F7P69_09260 [Cellulosimicrobium funkei]|nr:hypothetical protein [Cellulosimicrobium funkei]
MPPSPRPEHQGTDASGPIVVWCAGHRCSAVRDLHQEQDATSRLRTTVANTAGAVLISSPCLGRCELASVAAVGHRDGAGRQAGPMVWFSGLDDEARFSALRAWVRSGGPQTFLHPDRLLPSALKEATCGLSAPPVIHRG